MKFTKMHGIGNDYIFINCLNQTVENISATTKFLSNRHFGIGSDGVVLILPSLIADFKMDIYNSDGSRAEMCGNAIRCIGKYVYDNTLINKKEVTIETLSGLKTLQLHTKESVVWSATVDMGVPVFNTDINDPYEIDGKTYNMTCVSMGNPHAVIFIDSDVNTFDVHGIGRIIENSKGFPNRTNVEFANIINKNTINMRVWERGAGETLACGTGACAVLCAAVTKGLCDRLATICLPGGNLSIVWNDSDDHIYMTGTTTKVFDGEIIF